MTERIRGANPFAVTTQQMKYLGVNLANETEDLYREKLEILKKKKRERETLESGKASRADEWEG